MTLRERIARAMEPFLHDMLTGQARKEAVGAVLAEIAAAGMVLVPREPTEAMRPFTPADVRDHRAKFGSGLREAYDACQAGYRMTDAAMLSAAPSGGEPSPNRPPSTE